MLWAAPLMSISVEIVCWRLSSSGQPAALFVLCSIGLDSIGLCSCGKIDAHKFTTEFAVLIALAWSQWLDFHTASHLQVVDAAERGIVKEQHINLPAFLQRGNQFGMEHQVAAVSCHGVHFAPGQASFAPSALLFHIPYRSTHIPYDRIRRISCPHALQVSRQTSGSPYDNRIRVNNAANDCNRRRLWYFSAGCSDKFVNGAGIPRTDNRLIIVP